MRGKLMFTKAVPMSGTLFISSKYAGAATGVVGKYVSGNAKWEADGATWKFSMSTGDLDQLQKALNKPTKGFYDLKLDQGGVAPQSTEDVSKKSGKKKKKNRGK